MVMTFDHIAIFVADIERSAAFYEKVFGFARIPEPFHDGRHIWLSAGPNMALHIVGNADAAKEHAISHHMAFRTEDFEGLMARLDAMQVSHHGFGVAAKFNTRGDGARQTYFQDPDNYWIEVNDLR
ncbi:MAG TPA: VOC family protein [Acidobacteriaceae bacterium]|nr:VOC family protein [Acidobacteriaceae bacterium]